MTDTRTVALGPRALEWPIVGGLRMARTTAAIVALLAAVCIVGAATTDGFLTVDNLQAVLLSSAFVGVIALGMTVIMLSGNLFSLSLGATAAVGAIAFLYGLRWGFAPALVFSVGIATAICAVQGLVIGGLGANPIIVTIAAGVIQAGITIKLTGGSTMNPPAGDTSFTFLNERLAGIPVPFIVFGVATLVLEFVFRRTRFGRLVYALGGSVAASRAAAMKISVVATGAFAVAGACAGLAGVLLAAANQNATLSIQGDYNYDAIAAVLVGGSAVTGGQGSALRTLFGVLVIATISSLLLLRGYSTGVQILVKGLIVFAVVVLVHLGRRPGR